MRVGSEQCLVVVLAVEIDESIANFLEKGQRNGRIVEETAMLPPGRYLAPNDELRRRIQFILLKKILDFRRVADKKCSFHNRFFRPFANNVRVCTFPEEQSQGIDENRFSSTGFPREDVQSMLELDVDFFDEGVMFDVEGSEHEVKLRRFWESFNRRESLTT